MNFHQKDQEIPKLDERDKKQLWRSFSEAIGAEIRERPVIRGISGIDHPVQAVAVDDKHKRVVIISAEQNARVAALIHGDVQSTMPDVRVLVARPVIVDLSVLARRAFRTVEDAKVNIREFTRRIEKFQKLDKIRSQKFLERQLGKTIQPIAMAFQHVTIPTLTQIMNLVEQLSYLDWESIVQTLSANPEDPSISFENLMKIDNMEIDRKHGVCPIPLYEFKDSDWDLFFEAKKGTNYNSA